jgi:hypothetical protein
MWDFKLIWQPAGTVIVEELLIGIELKVFWHMRVVGKSIGEDMIHQLAAI